MAKGVSVVNSAVSLLNAVPLGVGSSLAINIHCRVESRPTNKSLRVYFKHVDPGDYKLVNSAYDIVKRATGYDGGFEITIESKLPPRRGLKTSSSVSNALVASMLEAIGLDPDWRTILGLSVEASRKAGVTVTGAFDDASASLLGGLVVTDNNDNTMLYRTHIPLTRGLAVLLLTPDQEIPKNSVRKERFEPLRSVAQKVLELIRSGYYWEALTLNGLMVAAALNIKQEVITSIMGMEGVLGVGVNGMGPSISVVAETSVAKEVAELAATMGFRTFSAVVENKPGRWWRE